MVTFLVTSVISYLNYYLFLITSCDIVGDGTYAEGNFANDIYKGVNLQTEIDAETDGTSTFYIRINDYESDSYDSSYETIDVSCNTPDVYGGEVNIYLTKK